MCWFPLRWCLHWIFSLCIHVLQVKKWTATQKGWSLWSMFMAVSNFAAAPAGGSLITKFFKQPSSTAKAQQKQGPSAHEDQLLQGQGLPEKASSCERQQGTVLATEPAAQCESAEQSKDAVSTDRQLKSVGSSAAADEQPSKDKSPPMASPTKALTSVSAIGLQGNTPARMSALPLSAPGSKTQQNQATAPQKQPCALLHATAALATPQGPIHEGQNLLQPSSSCPAPAMPDHSEQNQDSSAAIAACRGDISGASNQPTQPQAGQRDRYKDPIKAHGPLQQGAAKRPLEQAFAKEPEHRKKSTRCGGNSSLACMAPFCTKTCSSKKHCEHDLSVCGAHTASLIAVVMSMWRPSALVLYLS